MKRKHQGQNCEPKRLCVFCRTQHGTTREHVIARCFFAEKLPSNTQLITVPACESCNGGISEDEEYVRAVITSKWECEKHPSVPQTTIYRNFANNNALLSRLFTDTKLVPLNTPTGEYICHWPSLTPNWDRVEKVICKIIKGLYFYEFKIFLPETDGIFVFNNTSPFHINDLMNSQELGRDLVTRSLANGEFRYSYSFTEADRDFSVGAFSVWLLSFYDGFHSIVVTHPQSFHARTRWPEAYSCFHKQACDDKDAGMA